MVFNVFMMYIGSWCFLVTVFVCTYHTDVRVNSFHSLLSMTLGCIGVWLVCCYGHSLCI